MFVRALAPTQATLFSHRQEVDLSKLDPGKLMRLDWEGWEILVLHRTPEQIAWLKRYRPPELAEGWSDSLPSPEMDPRLRSHSPEYLVVGYRKMGAYAYLRESPGMAYRCGDFRYCPKPLAASPEVMFPGGFYCVFEPFAESGAQEEPPCSSSVHSSFVYDPAGRSFSPWLMPLWVPPHHFREDRLILGR